MTIPPPPEAIERAVELRGEESNAWEWFFLAMTRWQLGEKEAAREWYERAVVYMEEREPDSDELRRFRAEAAELMRLNDEGVAKRTGVTSGDETESPP